MHVIGSMSPNIGLSMLLRIPTWHGFVTNDNMWESTWCASSSLLSPKLLVSKQLTCDTKSESVETTGVHAEMFEKKMTLLCTKWDFSCACLCFASAGFVRYHPFENPSQCCVFHLTSLKECVLFSTMCRCQEQWFSMMEPFSKYPRSVTVPNSQLLISLAT